MGKIRHHKFKVITDDESKELLKNKKVFLLFHRYLLMILRNNKIISLITLKGNFS